MLTFIHNFYKLMKYLLFLIIIIGAVFLYSSITQNKVSESDRSLVAEEYSANWLTDLSVVKQRQRKKENQS